MLLIREFRRRSYKFLGPCLALCVVIYFSYHLLYGNRGLFAWQQLEVQLAEAKERHGALTKNETYLENRVESLRPYSICPDLLVERAKEVIGFIHPDELVVIEK
jgi:cell division protein FtsB